MYEQSGKTQIFWAKSPSYVRLKASFSEEENKNCVSSNAALLVEETGAAEALSKRETFQEKET